MIAAICALVALWILEDAARCVIAARRTVQREALRARTERIKRA